MYSICTAEPGRSLPLAPGPGPGDTPLLMDALLTPSPCSLPSLRVENDYSQKHSFVRQIFKLIPSQAITLSSLTLIPWSYYTLVHVCDKHGASRQLGMNTRAAFHFIFRFISPFPEAVCDIIKILDAHYYIQNIDR